MSTKSKVTPAHSTFIQDALGLRKWAQQSKAVSKMTAGVIKVASSGQPKLMVKVKLERACLLLKVRGKGAVQEIRVYGDLSTAFADLQAYARSTGVELRVVS